jgi:alkanesulfonate monooxygenase SsuD/methylene tetrahydromethanopterin reductase-like flavin-dependent oxidoreductase (luciferase family)
MFFHVTEDPTEANAVISLLSAVLGRPPEELRQRFLVGAAEQCVEKVAAYAQAGAERILLWPVRDELRQLELFSERVASKVHG